jgi:outer membrane receptor for ferrienterochelin and colicin
MTMDLADGGALDPTASSSLQLYSIDPPPADGRTHVRPTRWPDPEGGKKVRLVTATASLVLISAALSATPPVALASEPIVVGRVVEAGSGAPLAGARVKAGEREAVAGPDGSFRLRLPAGPTYLSVSAAGHASATVAVAAEDGREIVVTLAPSQRFSENVEVTARAPRDGGTPASVDVQPAEVMKAAGAADNVFRVLQTLPGVAATQEFSSRISVRGGGPDENLTVMDGIEISNPYRLQGLVSAFNPEMIESFSLDTGAFGVDHGDRLSSLLTIENRPGISSRSFAGSTALSITDGNAILEGKLPGHQSGSWILTGRRTYYDLVANRIVGTQLPAFDDLQTKVVWEPRPGTRLSLFGLRSRESADASFHGDSSGNQGTFLDAARNDLAAATLDAHLGQRLISRAIASWYRNTEFFDVTAQFQDNDLRSNAPSDAESVRRNIAFTRGLSVRDLAFREELSVQLSGGNLLLAGAETHRLQTGVSWRITGDRNQGAANGSSIRGGAGLPSLLDSSVGSGRSGAWMQDEIRVSKDMTVSAGVRLDHSEVNRRTDLSPRIAWSLDFGARTRLRAALGKYTQSPGYDKLVQSDYFVDLSHAGTLRLPNERSLHASLALERDLAAGLQARVEAYYKSFDHLTVGRLETEAERQARVAQYDFPPELQSSVPTDPLITSNPVGDGRGRAYGFDLYVTKRATSPDTRLTGWASYTWGRATRDAYGITYPFDYDRRHALSVVESWRVSEKLELSTTLRVATGFPWTPPVGLRVSAAPDVNDQDGDGSTTDLVPQRDAAGRLVYTPDRGGLSNLNSAYLPLFARLDLRASFCPKGRKGRWLFYLEVINLLNRKNPGSVEATLAYDPGSDRPRMVEQYGGSLPRLPSFGVRFRF